jgi:hypothetical protein
MALEASWISNAFLTFLYRHFNAPVLKITLEVGKMRGDEKITCANCGITITWKPTIVDNKFYCCIGCSQGGPCTCDYSRLPRPEEKAPIIVKEAAEEKGR